MKTRNPALITVMILCMLAFVAHAAPHYDMKNTASPADEGFMDGMMKMDRNMKMRPTGNPDYDFTAMMIPHHQGAVDMAKTELQYGKDPQLRKLAHDIVASQEKEITFMKAWKAVHSPK